MLYADDAEVVSLSPKQLRTLVGVVVVFCTAFGLTVSEAKTEIVCLRTKGVSDYIAIFSEEAAGEVYSQTNEFIYLGGDVNHNVDQSTEVDRRMRNTWCSFRKYTLELYDLPSAALELEIRMLIAEVLEIMRLRHMEPARLPLRHTAPSPSYVLTRCTGWQKRNRADHPISYMNTLIKTGSETSRRRYARGWALFAGFVAHGG